jgi:hypothetical protein
MNLTSKIIWTPRQENLKKVSDSKLEAVTVKIILG